MSNAIIKMKCTLEGINNRVTGRTEKWPERQNGGNHCHGTK